MPKILINCYLSFFHSYRLSNNFDTISKELSMLYFKGSPVKIYIILCISVPGDFFFHLANSAGPDEIPPYAAFHLGLQCFPKYLLTGIQNEKA